MQPGKGCAVMGAPKPCTAPGCAALVRDGSGRCPAHKREQWAKHAPASKFDGITRKGSGKQRKREREAWFKARPYCVRCQCEGRMRFAVVLDHVIALAEGGRDDASNKQGLCGPCHDDKTRQEAARGRERERMAAQAQRGRAWSC